jgi:hypothetical protein
MTLGAPLAAGHRESADGPLGLSGHAPDAVRYADPAFRSRRANPGGSSRSATAPEANRATSNPDNSRTSSRNATTATNPIIATAIGCRFKAWRTVFLLVCRP